MAFLARKVQSATGGGGPVSSFTYIDTTWDAMANQSGVTSMAMSSSAQSGDLAIFMAAIDNASPSITTPPTGFTLLNNGTSPEYPKCWFYYKIVEAGDPGATVSATWSATNATGGLLSIFRPNGTITTVNDLNFFDLHGPSTYSTTLSATGVDAPAIAFVTAIGRVSQNPTLTYATSDAIVDNGGSAPRMGYNLYSTGETPAGHSVSINDTGRQSLAGMYIEVT